MMKKKTGSGKKAKSLIKKRTHGTVKKIRRARRTGKK